MRRIIMVSALLAGAASCMSTYHATDLAVTPVGTTRQDFLSRYTRPRFYSPVPRASRVTPGDTLEVFTMPLQTSAMSGDVEYWFVFRNSQLVQWGRPEDWKNVSATYQIEFNPTAGVRTP